jgi:hypothetical protein
VPVEVEVPVVEESVPAPAEEKEETVETVE